MKTIKLLIMILFVAGISNNANAQFFKKLKKKVEKAVENTVINKTSDKAADKTGKAMEKMFDMDFGKDSPIMGGGNMGSMEDIAASYDFEWIYKLEMESDQFKKSDSSVNITYYLKKDAPYWGAKFEMAQDQGMLMVYDAPTDQMVMLMDQKGQKIAMVTKMPQIDPMEEKEIEDYTISKIAGKEILGYSCDGFKMVNDDYEIIFYVTFETEVGFGDIYGKNKYMPKGFEPSWLKKGDISGLMLEMQMVDKNKSKNNMTMTCVTLEEQSFSIDTSDYKSFGKY